MDGTRRPRGSAAQRNRRVDRVHARAPPRAADNSVSSHFGQSGGRITAGATTPTVIGVTHAEWVSLPLTRTAPRLIARARRTPRTSRSKKNPTPATYTAPAAVAHVMRLGARSASKGLSIGISFDAAAATRSATGRRRKLAASEDRSGTANSGPHATKMGSRSITTTTAAHTRWATRGERMFRARRTPTTPKASTVMRAADSARISIFIILSSAWVRARGRAP